MTRKIFRSILLVAGVVLWKTAVRPIWSAFRRSGSA